MSDQHGDRPGPTLQRVRFRLAAVAVATSVGMSVLGGVGPVEATSA